MKVDREEKNLLHEGGEETQAESEGPKSKEDRYKDRADNFSVTDSGLNLETGLNFKRGCTDMVCVVVFLAFIATMMGTAFYGIAQGDPKAFIKPYDHTNMICGVNDTVKDYGKLYFTKLAPDYFDGLAPKKIVRSIVYSESVCVKECPKEVGQPILCPPGKTYDEKCKDEKSVATTSVMDICWPKYSSLSD